MRLPPKISAGLSALILSACGGGGGGGSYGNLSQLIEFSSWANVQANQTVRLQGISHNADYTAPAPNFVVTQLAASTDPSSTVSITYDGQQNVSSIVLTSGSKSQTFATSSGDTIGNLGTYLGANYSDIAFAVDATGTNIGIAAEPLASNLNWNYQSYGAWETGRGTGSGYAAVASVGNMTSGAGIPTTGNAIYTGYSGGVAISADGTQDFIVSSDFQATADFSTRSVSIQATNSGSYDPVNDITNINDTQYNYTGVATYDAGSNSLHGTIITSGGNNGTVCARFYGPSASEIGGIFEARGAGVSGYFGAFGAKQ